MKNINKLLKNKIKEYKTIVIAKHINPDWDAQGSAIGLANIINDNFKNKNIYVVGSRINEDKTFLIDDLTDEIIKESLLITVDTANKERIDFEKYHLAKEIFKIDHHLKDDNYGDLEMVDDKAIACTQIISLWAKEMKLKTSSIAAKNLYKGLVTDSGRFLFNNVNSNTFNAASFLVGCGVDLNEIQKELYLSNLNLKQWQNKAFSMMKISKQGVGYIVANTKDYEEFNLKDEEVKSCLFTMSGIKEIPIWCTIIKIDKEIKVSLRSRDYDVNSVAKKFNGGGHRLASGAKLNNMKEVSSLIKELDLLIKNEIK